jgi:16S rRNA (adenine1518-N6/adenine1519-N6)-dimethyltransferase
VVTVELDRQLFQLAGEELHSLDNVHMLQVDALETKNRLRREVLEAIDRELSAAPDRQFKLVANLPYNTATPILTNLLALERPPRTMTVTIQKELADRIIARPGSKDFGALSLWVQCQCRVEVVRVMPPSVFWPRPKVHSAIIQITLVDELRDRIADRAFFHEFIRAMFLHRRKFIRSELITVVKDRLAKADVDRLLAEAGIDPQIRAEQVGVEGMLRLSEAVRAALGR